MAKIYYLREGTGPARFKESFDISVENLIAKLENKGVTFVGKLLPTYPAEREDLTPYRDPSRTLAEIAVEEVNDKFTKHGYYLLEGIDPAEASGWLSS